MNQQAKAYHAEFRVCVDVEQRLAGALEPVVFQVELIHLGTEKRRLKEAEAAGVKSVPALVIDGRTYHNNFDADLSVLK